MAKKKKSLARISKKTGGQRLGSDTNCNEK